MTCEKCNTPIPEGGVYCPNCGERADGKKPCPNCGKYIDGSFCTYCGYRLDGKIVCSSCGQLFEGNFCPFCGTQGQSKPKKQPRDKTSVKNVLSLSSSISALCALLVFFICSFFVGVTVNTVVGKDNATTIYFFKDVYVEIRATIDKLNVAGLGADNTNALFLLPNILCTVFLAINLLASFGGLVWGGVAFYLGVSRKKQINLLKPLCLSLTTFILAASMVTCVFSTEQKITSGTLSVTQGVSLSAGSVSAIVICGTAILASVILKQFSMGKDALAKLNVLKIIFGALVLAFAITFLSVTNDYFMKMSSSGGTVKASLFITYMSAGTAFVSAESASFSMLSYWLCLIAYIIIMLSAACLIATVVGGFFGKNVKTLSLVSAAVAFASVLLYFIMGIIGVNDLKGLFSGATISIAGLILTLVFSLLVLALTITDKIVSGKRAKKVIF